LRDFFLRALVLFGAVVVFLTEILSPFQLLRRAPLAAAWLAVALAAAAFLYFRRPKLPRISIRPLEATITGVIALIAGIVGVTAILSPPNSADAMAYHMPRVIYWAQSGSVAFFPTSYFNQISLQPLAEYVMLHIYVLSGGDHFINLVTFAAFLASIMGISAVSGALGLGSKGQAFAALVCATLPNGILQASGAKNDWLLAGWLVCLVYFAARRDAPFSGLAAGLAMATKATAYLFAPPLVAGVLVAHALLRAVPALVPARFAAAKRRDESRRGTHECVRHNALRMAAFLAGGVLLINAPQYVRNLRLSGSPLGYDSAHGDGFFRWRNEHPGWKSTVSNLLRNTSEQLGARSPRWNQAVFDAVVRIHHMLGIDPQDADTTWRWERYQPPINANHEANANNRWHLLLMAIAAALVVFRPSRLWTLYAAALLAAFLLFCFYVKWQPYLARLELPLFVLASPLAAHFLERLRPALLAMLVCAFLVNNARPALFENWTRPLKGPNSLWVTSRDSNYFSDMVQWNKGASYLPAVELTARSGCETVGIDISQSPLEYPFQALLRERNPNVRFVHTGVENASARYAPQDPPRPCAVLCLDCAGIQRKIALYAPLGPPIEIGRFLLFVPR
jgi:hypothetical protein